MFHRFFLALYDFSRHFKTRRAYCAVSLINYSVDLILISWMFVKSPIFLDVLFCVTSALIGISITGLYLKRPSVMLPDILYKIIVSGCALFNAILDVENETTGSSIRLLMVLIALLSHFYENYFLFNAISALYREQDGLDSSRPPPSYNLFAKSAPIPQANARKTVEVKPIEIEEGRGGEEAEEEQPRCSTPPPPSYEFAMERIKEQSRIV
ncbi:unnamed protein product [Caenorhabditis angaria]|uniref:Uncharacterized protein n=1 Tax=Caenorhabditis angaria TaxID=860376 RepID=A0A9P1N102_9PELO|nr:unnamed protein product [Caenorhabditis angaria]